MSSEASLPGLPMAGLSPLCSRGLSLCELGERVSSGVSSSSMRTLVPSDQGPTLLTCLSLSRHLL